MIEAALPLRSLYLDDAGPGGRTVLFADPAEWIVVRDPADVSRALARIDTAVASGKWAAGSFAFELGYLLEPRLTPLFRPGPDPLIAVGIYDGPRPSPFPAPTGAAAMATPSPLWTEADYTAAFNRVRDYIAAGDVYQVNLTFPLMLPVSGDPASRLAAWRTMARARHAALQRQDDRDIYSFSPELFVASGGGGVIRARPMKGTAPRAPDSAGEAAARAALAADPKQRAENLMIVDLIRNDLSRIAQPASVTVTDLFTVETYPTLHTMTSGIEARMAEGVAPSDVLRALFPCGSVTGAPKVRAMEIIAELEPQPRGVYCGALGAFGPGGRIDLNVAIRTLVHEHGSGMLRLSVGGGVVFDSRAPSEYAEGLLKARFATAEPFRILETLRWEPEAGAFFLEAHLARMAGAADYFAAPFDRAAIEAALSGHVAAFDAPRRVRLLLDLDGGVGVESSPLVDAFAERPDAAPVVNLAVASGRLMDDAFTRHKTTRRAIYDAALAGAKAKGADEAILLNAAGRVADGSYMTIFARIGGRLVTPPREEGALPGVLKASMRDVAEAPLTLDDLAGAEALFAGNSVRGLRRAVLI
ncbi:MAG: aminodeoxychorismate synthase component I [Micropepsaceae bacterium]